MLTTINLLLELGVQYLKLKIKNTVLDTLDKFDARIDKLDERRRKLRAENNSAAHEEADRLLNEIVEEKKKFRVWQNQLDGETKQG
jgi:FtsZ-binding cell division protein ZapB